MRFPIYRTGIYNLTPLMQPGEKSPPEKYDIAAFYWADYHADPRLEFIKRGFREGIIFGEKCFSVDVPLSRISDPADRQASIITTM